jgi:hypothetical protein
MTETKLEEWAYGFMTFIFGIAGDIISFCVTMGLLYATFYIIGRYLVCQNDDQEWSKFTGHIRSGIKDLAEAFKNATPAIKAAAKEWADTAIECIEDILD